MDGTFDTSAHQFWVFHHVILIRSIRKDISTVRRDGTKLNNKRVLRPSCLKMTQRSSIATASVPILQAGGQRMIIPALCLSADMHAYDSMLVLHQTSQHATVGVSLHLWHQCTEKL